MGKYGASAGVSTELLALVAAQVNVSSIGNSYTDTAGDTYAETGSQTRLTMNARQQYVSMAVSGHVNAGTGTFELFNFTDSTSLATATTTSTSEALLTVGNSAASTNNSDAITLRVKNSGVGGQTTIDGGGMLAYDGPAAQAITAVTADSSAGGNTLTSTSNTGYATQYSIALIKRPSTATLTLAIQGNLVMGNTFVRAFTVGGAFGTAEANTVVLRTASLKVNPIVVAGVGLVCSAISASASWVVGLSFEYKADVI